MLGIELWRPVTGLLQERLAVTQQLLAEIPSALAIEHLRAGGFKTSLARRSKQHSHKQRLLSLQSMH